MNDRASKKPPSLYTRDEEAMARFLTPTEAGGHVQNRDTGILDADFSHHASISSSKHSSMFRFGKAIVNAFNPANVWQGFNGMWKETEEIKSPEKDILQERQAKAEKTYAELKHSGFKGTKAPSKQRASVELPTIRYDDVDEAPCKPEFRDSGIDMDGYRSSTEHSKDYQVFAPVQGLMPPPPVPRSGRSPSPMVTRNSGRRSSLTLHKPSLQSLKKVKSHFHLLPTKIVQSEVSLPLPSIEFGDELNTATAAQPLRNSPSKKDLVKQQKLTMKVSDLEMKLDKARRELEGLHEPSKLGLKPFKPGALPSLPSQRILQSHDTSNVPEEESFHDDKPSETGPYVGDLTPQANSQLQSELRSSVSREPMSRKRKSVDALYNPNHEEDTSDSVIDPIKWDVANKGSVRSRKSQKIEESVAIESSKARHGRNVTPNGPRRISSRKTLDPVPPLPTMPEVFDPSRIDQAKVLSLRSVSNSNIPFGRISVDAINLRVLYPTMTEAQVIDYMNNLPHNKKKTDHKSLSHQDRPASPFLAPPLSASPNKTRVPPSVTSPMKTRSKMVKRGISPPPPSLVSPKRMSPRMAPKEDDDTATMNSEGHDTVAPLPESLSNSKERIAKHADKPLPGIQKEDYEWPEDVF